MLKCKCDSTWLYANDDGTFSCYHCGEKVIAEGSTPYPGNATREQWVQEVAARLRSAIYAQSAYGMDNEEVIANAEAFVTACDKHFGREAKP